MQCVSFNHRVTVYPADDYDRIDIWMHAAVDRMRFRRKIEQTELILALVLLSHHQTCCGLSKFFLLTQHIFAESSPGILRSHQILLTHHFW